MEFPDILIAVRKKLTLSQADLANELGVSFSTINRWENKKASPSYKKLRKFKDLCNKHNIKFKGWL